ncbi:MAG: o-succinylbenzoate--CoA ligase [Solirubrobacterales bacterium]|nr:o-succinylbenzoate--CoA ligase [Solirubrobacterales bacterium]
MLLDNWLAQRAETCPDRIAVATADGSIDYAALEAEATSLARRLAAKGVRRDSTVAISMQPGIDYVAAMHALMKLGATAFPLDPRLSPDERAAALGAQIPALVVESADDLAGHEADLPLLGELDLDAPFTKVLTSGTSGSARAIEHSYGNHLWSAVGSAFNLGVDPGDRWLCCVPLFHVSGVSILLRSAIYGTTAVVHDGFDLDRVAESLEEDGITIVSLVTTMLTRLIDAGAAIERPRAILVGGGPVPDEIIEEALGLGATVVQTYGLTEASSQVTTLAPEDSHRKRGSAGRPLLTTHVRIQDGEILVQGPTVAPASLADDGWLHTGDSGHIDPDGFLWVEGRLDDVIVTGGENVAPAEVEEVLSAHPDVLEAAVIGRPDPDWQNAVVAVLVANGAAEPDRDSLRSWCSARLAPYKVPKRFELVAELPRTASGKLRRGELR